MGRLFGRIARRVTRTLITRPALGMGILVTLILGTTGLIALGLTGMVPGFTNPLDQSGRSTMGSSTPMAAGVTHQAPTSTEGFLRGNQTSNADLIWQSLTTEAQDQFRARVGSAQEMQRQLEAAREQGTLVEDFSYIGGQNLPDGTSMHFYLVLTRGPQSRNDPSYIPYVFTLDRGGKIARLQ